MLSEYPGYTLRTLEEELTWEQVSVLILAITKRKEREAGIDHTESAQHREPGRHFDLDTLDGGAAAMLGLPFKVVQKVVTP